MKISTFLLFDGSPEGGPAPVDTLERGLALCRAADELEFDTVWVAEHHFGGPGKMPNPAVFLAAAAQVTRRVKLAPAVAILPFRHPALTAENYALVDRLSGGRLKMGVGSGAVADEFAGLGLDIADKQRLFEETLAALRQYWTAGSGTAAPPASRPSNPRPNVAPVQSPPPIYVATQRACAAREIGRQGLGLLTLVSPTLESVDEIEPRLREHRAGVLDGGFDPGKCPNAVVVMAAVGEDTEGARSAHEPHLCSLARSQGISGQDGRTLYETMRGRGTGAFGSSREVAETLTRVASLGADEIVLWNCFGGMPAATAIDSMCRARGEVVPRVDDARESSRG